jgi:hypothetical protein
MPADKKTELFYETVYKNLQLYSTELKELPETLCEHSPHGQPVLIRIREMLKSRLESLIDSGVKEGVFDIKEEQACIDTLLFMTGFMNLHWMRHQPENLRNTVMKSMVHILLNGLKRRP